MRAKQVHNGWIYHRWASIILLVVLTVTGVTGVRASVSIVDFVANAGDSDIEIIWETGSEINNLGFYIWRSTSYDAGFERIEVVDGMGEMVSLVHSESTAGNGAFYVVTDTGAVMGIRYFYKLADVPADGSGTLYHEIVSARILPDWQVMFPIAIKQ